MARVTDKAEIGAWWGSGTALVVWIALGTVLVHVATGWRYGFDRDELMALEDARHLTWGYVQYPPMTAFLGRVALELFGTSLVGFRLFAALAQALAVVLTGLMAKELGGGRWAQVVAALAGVPFCLGAGALMQYISFDYVCWVWVAYCITRVMRGGWLLVARSKGVARGSESGNWKLENGDEEDELKTHPQATRVGHPGIGNQELKMKKRGPEGKSLTPERGELRGGDARWWVWAGVGVGLGMLAKYTMLFLVCGVVVGVVATPARRYLRIWWFWIGVAVALAIFAPNFIWEWKRGFVSLEFLRFLHVRDMGEGLTDWFLLGQVEVALLAFPLAVAGLWFYFSPSREKNGENGEEDDEALCGKRFRILGWMYLVPLVLFLVMRGRDYYLAPGYPILYAAGAVWVERKMQERRGISHSANSIRSDGSFSVWIKRVIWVALVLDVVVAGAVALPVAPVGSRWWNFASRVDSVFPEEIGWPEFVESVAQVRDRLPAEERGRVEILAGNYGEVGALNLYGEKFELPRAISGVNSSWERGYGNAPSDVVIVVGYSREFLDGEFVSVEVGGRVWNRYGVMNEETIEDPEIFVCRGLKGSWKEFWKRVRNFA